MSSYLDTERLAELIRNKCGGKGLREVAKEIVNVSPSTLSRIENGKTLDMDTFLALCDWLKVPPAELIENTEKTSEFGKVESFCFKVRSDLRLSPDVKNVLAALIKAAYSL